MKTAKEWVDEKSGADPFDEIESRPDAQDFVRNIQLDTIMEIRERLRIIYDQNFEGNRTWHPEGPDRGC